MNHKGDNSDMLQTSIKESQLLKRTKRISPDEEAKYYCTQSVVDKDGFKIKFISDYKGFGVFSETRFNAGDFLLQYCGERISAEEGRRRLNKIGTENNIDAEDSDRLCQMVNNAPDTDVNAVMKLKVFSNREYLCLFAVKNIEPGEELLYNYGDKENLWWRKKVLQKGEGNLIVYRRPGVPANAYDYIHCRFCKGFYHHKLLWSHFKPDGAENDTERNFIREARCEIAPFLQQQDEDIEMLDEVIDKMKETKENPGLKKVCQEDELIRQFGLYHLGRLGPLEEQRLKDQDNVRTKMRSLARLLVRLNGEELFSYPLSHFICAQKFDLVAKTVKEMYQEIGSSQLGLNLGHYIKQVSLLKSSMCLRRQDCGRKKEANEFTEMFDAEWKGKVSSVANRSKRLKAMNKRCELPSTEDLVSLKKILVEEIQIKMENPAPTYPEYVYITHLLIARIALFNKRRVNEVSELKVSDFQKRIRGDELDTNTEIYNSLAVSEKALLKRMELLEVRGKSTRGLRKVFVILSTDMVEGLSHLLMVRAQAGVPSTNTFLFSRCTDSPQDGCEALRVVTSKCHNLAFPERVRTTKLRKYLATTTQIMDMRDDELKLIADHMGHSVAIHTEVYRMPTSVLERTKVARALLALEDGKLQGFNGRNLSSNCLNLNLNLTKQGHLKNCLNQTTAMRMFLKLKQKLYRSLMHVQDKKKRWSKEEKSALREAFDIQIKMQKNVSTMEIRKAQKCYPVLQGRSEAVIRTKINNIKLGKYKKI
ncbi:KT5AA-like protein [Mya arenaria]|uniref:KT5AA-like protein n=1 Tax=Mya arenaria TaxID=6604 RepID=A0ABY7G1C3_MYAAR|nr:KT5AA-like protein [Mya arenaria]